MPPLNIIWWVIFILWLFSGFVGDNPGYPWVRPGRHFVEAVLLAILAIAVFGK
jgi:hypothetical protein